MLNVSKLIYIVGMEGSGHHGFVDEFLFPLSKEREITCYNNSKTKLRDGKMRFFIFSNGPTGLVKNSINLKEYLYKEKNTVFIEDKSFPSGSVNRIPPFPLCFDNLYAKIPSVKILLLIRNYLDTVLSHRTFDNGLIKHAEKMSHYSYFLSRTVRKIPKENWKAFYIDCIYKSSYHKIKAVNDVRKFLNWETEHANRKCCNCFLNWRSPKKYNISEHLVNIIYNMSMKYSPETWWPFLAPKENAKCS